MAEWMCSTQLQRPRAISVPRVTRAMRCRSTAPRMAAPPQCQAPRAPLQDRPSHGTAPRQRHVLSCNRTWHVAQRVERERNAPVPRADDGGVVQNLHLPPPALVSCCRAPCTHFKGGSGNGGMRQRGFLCEGGRQSEKMAGKRKRGFGKGGLGPYSGVEPAAGAAHGVLAAQDKAEAQLAPYAISIRDDRGTRHFSTAGYATSVPVPPDTRCQDR
eukprot:3743379-Rhodomonas_salina.4